MKRFLTTLLFLSLLVTYVVAQSAPFNGVVVDGQGHPLGKIKISVKGVKNKYTRSDKEGRFGLSQIKSGDVLQIKSKNYTHDVTVEDPKGIRITIVNSNVNSQSAPELADFGYGYVKRREYGSRSTGISGEDLVATGAKDILEAISAKVPGMNFSPGGFGTNSSVQMGGTKSFSGSTMPLFVVDGMKTGSIDHLRITDVEYVEVSKDGTMYGSEGANGVIIIKTKQ